MGMEELRANLIPLATKDFYSYMKDKSQDGIIRLYDMAYIRFAKEEPHLFSFLSMRSKVFSKNKQNLSPLIECSIDELMKFLSDCLSRSGYSSQSTLGTHLRHRLYDCRKFLRLGYGES